MGQNEEPGLGGEMGGQVDPGAQNPQQEGGGQGGVFLPGPVGSPHRVEQPAAQEQVGDQSVAHHGQNSCQPHPCRQGLPGEGGGGNIRQRLGHGREGLWKLTGSSSRANTMSHSRHTACRRAWFFSARRSRSTTPAAKAPVRLISHREVRAENSWLSADSMIEPSFAPPGQARR